MNALLMTAALAVGQARPDAVAPPSTSLDGVWTIVAMEVNGRPETIPAADSSLAIKNNTLTLPGLAAMHGTIRLDPGPRGTLRAFPAAVGTGNRRDPSQPQGVPAETTPLPGTSGTGVVGGAHGVYVRTADYLVLTIGNPAAATATGTGVGPTTDAIPAPPTTSGLPAPPVAGSGTLATVGQPPVSLVLRRATGRDAPPSTAAAPPPAVPAPTDNGPAMHRLSSVMGTNVTLADGSTAGRIDDVVYGAGGTIDFAVLGNNGTFAAVPWSALNWGANGLVSLPLTRDQFGTIQTFGANDLQNLLANPDFTGRLRTTFANFRDANGRPLFSTMMNKTNGPAANRTATPNGTANGNTAAATTGNRTVNRPPNPPANPQPAQPNAPAPAPQPGTRPPAPPRPPK